MGATTWRNRWSALAVAGALAACAAGPRPVVQQRVAVIPPPTDAPAAGGAPSAAPDDTARAAAPPASAATSEPATAAAAPASGPSTAATSPSPPPAASPADPNASPAAAPADAIPPGALARVDVIYFKPDAYKFDPSYRPVLDARAQQLKATPGLHLVIRAWSDPHGARDYNLALSRKRAEVVARYLIAQGVPQTRLELVSHGERRQNESASERLARSDRRVELQYRMP
jgi:peptidoglycan-associated lipoprotein